VALDSEISAIHEAGHYLYGHVHEIPLNGIIMEPDSRGTFRAAVRTTDLQGWIETTKGTERLERLRLAIGFKLAGQHAQLRKFGNLSGTVGESGNDLAHITVFRRQIKEQFPDEDQQVLMDSIKESVDATLKNPTTWASIEALAAVLAVGRNVSHDQVVVIISRPAMRLENVCRCALCLGDCESGKHIISDCVPAPFFGSPNCADVITIAINPSAGEFFDRNGLKAVREKFPMPPVDWNSADWPAKPTGQRLKMLRDFGIASRESLTNEHISEIGDAFETYFSNVGRKRHGFFTHLQRLLTQVNSNWEYRSGTASHVDIVACTTAKDWSDVPAATRAVMAKNCQLHFTNTLRLLKPEVWLLVDGAKALRTLAGVCPISIRADGVVSSHIDPTIEFKWSTGNATLAAAGGACKLRYFGWNIPWQQHRMFDLQSYHVELLKCIIGFLGSDSQLKGLTSALRSPSWS
jgi:hypothetical protein